MKKTFVLTSFAALTIAMPTMADNNSNYTQSQTYSESCNVTNLGAYDSSTGIATANFTINTYSCLKGQYLAADALHCTTCPAGSFCDSAATYTYDSANDQGIESCPNGYTNSYPGSTSETECYRACAIANNGTTFTNIPHASAVSGNDYYGTDADTCIPTACDSGYHIDDSTPNLIELIGFTGNATYGYINHAGTFGKLNGSNGTAASYGISGNDTWGVDYGDKGMITGKAVCSTEGGESANDIEAAWGTGYECWCQIDTYTPKGNTKRQLDALWVYIDDSTGSAVDCVSSCAENCASRAGLGGIDAEESRRPLFESIMYSDTVCSANTITVRWGDGNGGVHESNTCTYGGTLTTPTTAPSKRGYTFTGWTFDLGNN